MAKECNNTSCDKASCEGCSSSKKQQSFLAEMNAQSNVKHVIGVVSGKGRDVGSIGSVSMGREHSYRWT